MSTTRQLTPAQRAALATSAAERVMAILNLAASKATTRTARHVLDRVWATIEDKGQTDVQRTTAEIEGLHETRATDPNRRAFFAMEALEMVAAAVAELRPGDAMAGRYEEVAAGIMSSYDGLTRQLELGRPRIVDPRNPPPAGLFELEERRRQAQDRDLVIADEDLPRTAESLRTRSQFDAIELQTMIGPLLARYR